MKRLFIDSDILLDVLLDRPPHFDPAAALLNAGFSKSIQLYTSGLVVSHMIYFLKDVHKYNQVKGLLNSLLNGINICTIDHSVIEAALFSNWKELEDAIQYFAAIQAKVDAIITRNKKDYKLSRIPVYTAAEWGSLT